MTECVYEEHFNGTKRFKGGSSALLWEKVILAWILSVTLKKAHAGIFYGKVVRQNMLLKNAFNKYSEKTIIHFYGRVIFRKSFMANLLSEILMNT